MYFSFFLARRGKIHREAGIDAGESPRALHVERMEVEDRPLVHVERTTVMDTEHTSDIEDTETTVEKKVTVVRRRKKKTEQYPTSEPENNGGAPS